MTPTVQPTAFAASNTYDEMPYTSHPFAQSHPDRLATVARLFGMRSPPMESARVLELGCAAGGNVLPFAMQFPDSKVVGVDLSQRQVADGRELVEELGVKNCDLRHASIMDVDESYGEFDYIICHGVFSWVPSAVQEKIFDICDKQLASNGVAYISYNTYPGWHMRGMIRDMMRYHVERFNGAGVKVRQARSLLDFLQQSVKQDNSAYAILLKQEVETLKKQADSYLYHEHLEEVNEPMYFHQFAEQAGRRDLQYLGEARVGVMLTSNFGQDIEKTLRMLAHDIVQMEQYMDFLRNRMFRETLLCRKSVRLERNLRWNVVRELLVASPAKPKEETFDINANDPVTYISSSGRQMTTPQPLLKGAMAALREAWPNPLTFDELLERGRSKIAAPGQPEQDAALLGTGLLNCYLSSDLVELRTYAPSFVTDPGDKPVLDPLARAQLKRGVRSLTNRRHEIVHANDFETHLLPRLDGNTDRATLIEGLSELATRNVINVAENGQPIKDRERLQTALKALVDHALPNVGRNALLVG